MDLKLEKQNTCILAFKMFLKTSTAQILQVVVISVGDSLFRKTFKSLAFNNKKSCQKIQLNPFIHISVWLLGVTTQMKALSGCILMVLFVLLLKRVHFLTNEYCVSTKKSLFSCNFCLILGYQIQSYLINWVYCSACSVVQCFELKGTSVWGWLKDLFDWVRFALINQLVFRLKWLNLI